MQIQVQKLREAMKLLELVIPKKTTLPVLHNVLLKDGKAVAGNLEVFVFIDLPEANTECLIPHKPVMQLLKYVPGNEMLTLEANGEITFSWADGKSSYPRVKSDEYPPTPELVVKTEGTLDGNTLIAALTSISEYCAKDGTRPVLSGVTILPGENLDIAAGDGFRMAYQTIPDSFPIEDPLIIPSSTVKILNSLWQHTKPDVALGDSLVGLVLSKRHIDVALVEAKGSEANLLRVCFSGVTILLKLIEGNSPNFKQLIPEEIPTKVQFFSGDLERAIKRLQAIAADGSGMVKLSWTNDTMTVSASSKDVGKVEGTLPVQADKPDRVALNIKYLLEYLAGKDGMITMGVTGGTTPVALRHRASPLVIVQPMNAEW
ncbi:hypothetical protein LCGC14_0262540 [marine sediment metagenome]|uniref:DNA polymerase III beta sliding clamp C-terminal domain-containing protein n=1 Tax=marine sediment metagenome TaxID=412755 RepID=A0A0F9U172_9ZZZZ